MEKQGEYDPNIGSNNSNPIPHRMEKENEKKQGEYDLEYTGPKPNVVSSLTFFNIEKPRLEKEIKKRIVNIAQQECFVKEYRELMIICDPFELYNFLIGFTYSEYEWKYMRPKMGDLYVLLICYQELFIENNVEHNFTKLYR